MEDLTPLKQFYHQLKREGVRFRSIVSHGIALAIYCYDPDDNVVEIYAKTPYKIPQQLSEPVDLELSDEELLAIAEGGPTVVASLRTLTRPWRLSRQSRRRVS